MTSVHELFAAAGVQYDGHVAWGDPVQLPVPGVYVVSTSADPASRVGLAEPPLDEVAIDALLTARPEATVDELTATHGALFSRLRGLWPAGEPVVYIGLAGTSVQHRVEQFYRTQIGARAPHAGGWPVKMLVDGALWVHYGPTADPATAESAMVQRFVEGVPSDVAQVLADPTAPLPFANLTFPAGRRKVHGIRGVKEARSRPTGFGAATVTSTSAAAADVTTTVPGPRAGLLRYTQNVTPTDLSHGQLRLP